MRSRAGTSGSSQSQGSAARALNFTPGCAYMRDRYTDVFFLTLLLLRDTIVRDTFARDTGHSCCLNKNNVTPLLYLTIILCLFFFT